jgi:hypothetical protein
MEYYSNGRTARSVYEATSSNVKRRVIYSDELSEEEKTTVLRKDLLSREECLKIVTTE